MTYDLKKLRTVVIVGASRGIGLALAREFLKLENITTIHASFRSKDSHEDLRSLSAQSSNRLKCHYLEASNEKSIADFFANISIHSRSIDLLINCVGLLHDEQCKPEKSLDHVNLANLQRIFTSNAFLSPLLAKYAIRYLRLSEYSAFICLSAKVGSISDNKMGGWYAYRASKAALNMFLVTINREFQNRKIKCIALAIHPGTTRTQLSDNYLKSSKLVIHEPCDTAQNILAVLKDREISESGSFFSWDGSKIPW